jgi:sarcosine oxidase, subunit beta
LQRGDRGSADRRLPVPLRSRFSGHGSLQGPAVGEAARDLYYLNRTPAVDVSAFAVERFAKAFERTELNIV